MPRKRMKKEKKTNKVELVMPDALNTGGQISTPLEVAFGKH
jgi:hypothetical protein